VTWSEPLDLYCERTDASFWAEPANALTNVAFLIAAAAAYLMWRRGKARDPFVLALIGITFAIGLGSFAFHTIATRGAALLDVIPIALFVYGFLLLGLIRFGTLRFAPALGVLAAFIVASQAWSYALPAGFLNGSGEYLPPFAGLVAIGSLARRDIDRRRVLVAAAVFVVSLVCRTVDQAVCGAFPLGTHFAWHLLNGVMLYLLLRAAIHSADDSSAPSGLT
jgi:hypothetical protein